MSYGSLTVGLLLCAAAGCAASADRAPSVELVGWGGLWPELTVLPTDEIKVDVAVPDSGELRSWPAKPPGRELLQRLKEVQDLYIDGDDDGFAAAATALCEDPLGAYWVAYYLLVEMDRLQDVAPTKKIVAEDGSTVDSWDRPRRQLVALGGPASPCVVLNLVRTRDPKGFDVLRRMGPSEFGSWSRVLRVDDAKARRRAYETIHDLLADVVAARRTGAEAPVDAAVHAQMLEATEAGLADDEFGVRAQAWRAYAALGEVADPPRPGAMRNRIVQTLRAESDPFVRRVLLAEFAGWGVRDERPEVRRAVAGALVAAWERFAREEDAAGVRVARSGLRAMAGFDAGASPADWRAYIDSLPVEGAGSGAGRGGTGGS